MINSEKLEALNRVENAIAQEDDLNILRTSTYREALIASLVARRFLVKDANDIAEKKMLFSTVHDMNYVLATKHMAKVYDLELLNDEDNMRHIIENIESDDPLTMVNEAVKTAYLGSKRLVKEITRLIKTTKKHSDPNQSILILFGQETQENAQMLYYTSYWCYKFLNSVELEFTREDGTNILTSTAEFASSFREIGTGFSRRPFIPEDAGIWYDMRYDAVQHFVTTNVISPLSVAYVQSDGLITEIMDRKANDHASYANKVPVRYVMEASLGWFRKNDIKEGDYVHQKSIITEEKNF